MMEQSRALAAEVRDVDEMWRRAYGRAPSEEERREALAFLERQAQRRLSTQEALAELARALLNSNEFLYVD